MPFLTVFRKAVVKFLRKLYRILPNLRDFPGSELPVEDLFEAFLAGDVPCGGGETNVPDLAADLSPEPGGLAQQLGGGNIEQVAFDQLVLDATVVTTDLFPAFLPGGETFFSQRLGFDCPEVLDLELMLAALLD